MGNKKNFIDEKEYFIDMLSKIGVVLNDVIIDNLLCYMNLLYEKNKVMNLTAIREKKDILEKHFIDSLFLMDLIDDNDYDFIDVGTGAGFPGLVLAIVYPDKNFLLVDSVRKKVEFLEEVIKELRLKNVRTSFERAEELIKNNREYFDVALCRGVAKLNIILEYMIPFLKVNGRFLAQKLTTDEIEISRKALEILKSEIVEIHKFKLPTIKDDRIIIEIIKTKKTDIKYPRKTGVPTKNPL